MTRLDRDLIIAIAYSAAVRGEPLEDALQSAAPQLDSMQKRTGATFLEIVQVADEAFSFMQRIRGERQMLASAA